MLSSITKTILLLSLYLTLQGAAQTTTFSDNFNSGSLETTVWQSSSGQVRGNGEVGFLNGHGLWFGGNGSRHAETKDFNTLYGGTINFNMRTGNDGHPLWEASESGEYVTLEYSINEGASWRGIRYYAGWNPAFSSWHSYSYEIPAVARSLKTRFRFRQTRHNGVSWDHWAIDDFNLTTVDGGTSWSLAMPEGISVLAGTVDSTGTYHAVIRATSTFQLGTHSGSAGTYLTKTTGDGTWSTPTPSTGAYSWIRMAVDSGGNVYIASQEDTAKYNNNHVLQWTQTAHNASIKGITADSSGNVTIATQFDNYMRFGPDGQFGEPEFRTDEVQSFAIVRYNASGAYQWARKVGDTQNTGPSYIQGITGDGSGGFYVYGSYTSLLEIDPIPDLGNAPVSSGVLNPYLGFVIKYSSGGSADWSTHLGFVSDVAGLVTDGTSLYAATQTYGDLFTPATTVVGTIGGTDAVLIKLSPTDGSIQWYRVSGGVEDDYLQPRSCISMDGSGNPYMAHRYSSEVTVAGQTITEAPGYNLALTRWNGTGDLTWWKRAGTASLLSSMSTDTIGQTFISGVAGDLAAFESEAVLSGHFIHKFNNIHESTTPVGVFVLRQEIPSNSPSGYELGDLIAKDSDASGTYSFAFVAGQGDDHNNYFTIGGTGNDKLLLSSSAVLVESDTLSLRVSVTDENSDVVESVIEFTVGPPNAGLWATSLLRSPADTTSIQFCKTGPSGETLFGGWFTGSITMGSWTITSAGSFDGFLAKVDADGVPQWIIRVGSTGFDAARHIDINSSGNIYLSGTLAGGLAYKVNRNGINNFIQSTAPGGYDDLYILSLNPDGTIRWIRTMGGTGQQWPTGIKHDPVSGVTYVCGYSNSGSASYRDDATGAGGFYSDDVTGPTRTDDHSFVLGYNGVTGAQWVKFVTSNTYAWCQAVNTDSNGNVYVGGNFTKQANIGGYNKTAPDANAQSPSTHLFLWKLNGTGTSQWVTTGGSAIKGDSVDWIGVDASDKITLVGESQTSSQQQETAQFGSLTLGLVGAPSDYRPSRILVTYNSSGTALSGHAFGSNIGAQFGGFRAFPDGSIMLSGHTTNMDGAEFSEATTSLQLDASGTVLWSDNDPWGASDFAPDLSRRTAGAIDGTIEIAGQVLSGKIIYVAKLPGPAPIVAAPSAITLGSPAPAASFTSSQTTDDAAGLAPLLLFALPTPDALVLENEPVGTVVAAISASDTDSSSFTYQLFGGTGDDGNPLFAVSGNNLVTNAVLNYEEGSEYNIRLRVIDDTGQTHEQSFLIGITDLPDTIDAPVTLSDLIHVYDGQPHGAGGSTTPDGLPITFTYAGAGTEPSATGPYTVVASVDHPEYTGTGNGTLWIRTPIQDWLKAYYSDSDLNDPAKEATIWGDLADPDGDQILNIFENYHNTHPSQLDALAAAVIPVTITAQNKYIFRWKRDKNSASGEPVYQWSMDMSTWYDSGTGPSGDVRTFAINVETDNGSDEDVAATIDRGSEKTLFMRLKFP